MATHNEAGKEGEKLAEKYLVDKGFTILYRNWRYRHYELDLVSTRNGLLHITEVKLRNGNAFGHPEEAVTKKKIKSLMLAIEQFLFMNKQYDNFHLDILSITLLPGQEPEYFLIEDVYV